ncbi:hypothetical protein [Metasolibacillus fluoroglycofenilyticus]|uniref:hypothetical protein n=1 Tax=Metasolibacillus fluoroglycofenilyticus TaxID=1239396 RepID=UPI001379BA06|nr:hypothetical protein [Metasolibacillus fluoroglycofenilyticus]
MTQQILKLIACVCELGFFYLFLSQGLQPTCKSDDANNKDLASPIPHKERGG